MKEQLYIETRLCKTLGTDWVDINIEVSKKRLFITYEGAD
jgi:hypothetical protein